MSHEPGTDNLWRKCMARLSGAGMEALTSLLFVVVLFGVADAIWGSGHFASVRNLRVVLINASIVGVAALGMTLVIISGGIDLSAGTAMALCTTVLACGLRGDWPVAAALAAAAAAGCACGLVNGALVTGLRIRPFVATLGTMTICLGVGKLISHETTVFASRDQIPDWLLDFCSSRGSDLLWGFVPNIASGVIVALVLAAMVALVMHRTVFGKHVFAIGSNEATARLCGINVPATKLAVYTLAGLFVGICGIYNFANVKIGSPTEGTGFELKVIAAVVIGGGSLSGGRGSVVGTLTGATIMAVIEQGCGFLGIGNPFRDVIYGAVIIAAAALDEYRRRRLALAG